MNLTVQIKRLLKRKIATTMLVTASLAAFATLGDGGKRHSSADRFSSHSFSLRSHYNYRANNLFGTTPNRFTLLNNTVTYQKGNSTYILPLKKKVLLDKIKFNPANTARF